MPGFDTNRFIDLSEREAKHLSCSICLNIFDGAVKSRCEHTFCKSCVQQWIESNHKECPECRVKFIIRKRTASTTSTDNSVLIRNHIFKSNLLANSLVNDLTIKCDFDFNGCQQTIKLESLSSHIKECPHRLCAKCGLTFVERVVHNSVNCIDLLKNDRNELKDKYENLLEVNNDLNDENEKQMQYINELKSKNENYLEINNKLKEENCELKSKLNLIELKTIAKQLQNKTNNPIVDKRVSNNQFICHSIKHLFFGTFKTTLETLEVDQDAFKFMSLMTNFMNEILSHSISFRLPFNMCQEVMYCNEPSLRVIVIKTNRRFAEIQKRLGLFDKNSREYYVDSIYSVNNYIIIVFRADTQQFERCVQILESVKTPSKVEAINKITADNYIGYAINPFFN